MRVIAGRFKGHRLVHFRAEHIRPTTDRVKESTFARLEEILQGARVLDLFTGTGSLAVEAISRGAKSVDAIDNNRKSLGILRHNKDLLGLEHEVKVIFADVFQFLKRYRGEAYDLILADPPFTEKLASRVLDSLSKSAAVGPQTVVVVESSRHEDLPEVAAESTLMLERTDERDFGDKRVTLWKKSESRWPFASVHPKKEK